MDCLQWFDIKAKYNKCEPWVFHFDLYQCPWQFRVRLLSLTERLLRSGSAVSFAVSGPVMFASELNQVVDYSAKLNDKHDQIKHNWIVWRSYTS